MKVILAAAVAVFCLTAGTCLAQRPVSFLAANIGAEISFTHVYLAKIMGSNMWVADDQPADVPYAVVTYKNQKFVVVY